MANWKYYSVRVRKRPLAGYRIKTAIPSTNPHELKSGGALLPLGGDREHGSHKGYALGAVVDIFSAVLSGANYGPWVPPFPAYVPMPTEMPGKGIGHFFGAMRVDAFRPAADFKFHMDKWIRRFRSATPGGRRRAGADPGRSGTRNGSQPPESGHTFAQFCV